MPYFSVIIPLYNKENFIGKTIESVLAQTFADFEIIIVDDCSTDNSLAKAKEYISEKIRIVHHESNKGLSASRNTGIKNAATEFITFLDADDLWKPTFLEKIRELTLKFPQADLFATSYMELYPGNLEIAPSVNKSDIPPGDMVLVNDFFRKNLRQPIYNHSSVCIRRTLFEQVGNYDERINFSEDVDFNIRANAEGLLAFYNSVESYYVVYSENQITTSGIINKTIPMLDGFSRLENENPDIKKYVDFERYVLAMHCKLAGRIIDYDRFLSAININNLTSKQRMMLKLPLPILKLIKKVKFFLLLKGFRLTSY